MNKTLKLISNILVWIVVVFTVAVMIFTIVSVNTFNRNDREIFGYKAYIVLSDSMSATDFRAGDLVLVKRVDPTTLREGDIIAFTSQDPESYGQTVTHKIKACTVNDQGERGFITYGTTTGTEDQTIVTYPFILGKYQFSLPNTYLYSGFLVHTLDQFFLCRVKDNAALRAMDDVAESFWVPLNEVCPEEFGLDSVREGVKRFLKEHNITK